MAKLESDSDLAPFVRSVSSLAVSLEERYLLLEIRRHFVKMFFVLFESKPSTKKVGGGSLYMWERGSRRL